MFFMCVFKGRITHVKHGAHNARLINAGDQQIPSYQSNWPPPSVPNRPVSLLALVMSFLSPEMPTPIKIVCIYLSTPTLFFTPRSNKYHLSGLPLTGTFSMHLMLIIRFKITRPLPRHSHHLMLAIFSLKLTIF